MPWVSKAEALKLNIPHKTLQTIELRKHKFNLRQVKQYLREHNYANSYIRKTLNFYRAMQAPPIIGSKYWSVPIENGDVILVYQEY
jgi:hypothetical protein